MAKIDMRENRAEMPERRNVLRKVISPAVAEVAVEIRTEMPEVHYLKVQGFTVEGEVDEGSRNCGGFVCERDGDGGVAADPEGAEQGGMING